MEVAIKKCNSFLKKLNQESSQDYKRFYNVGVSIFLILDTTEDD